MGDQRQGRERKGGAEVARIGAITQGRGGAKRSSSVQNPADVQIPCESIRREEGPGREGQEEEGRQGQEEEEVNTITFTWVTFRAVALCFKDFPQRVTESASMHDYA